MAFQQKNDKHGDYIRKWVPALAKLPEKYIYEPWKAPGSTQKVDYPGPIVDHAVVSKQNMAKMQKAYDRHKASQGKSQEPPKKKMKKS